MTLLGIDLGTTSVKAAVFDDDGVRVAAARATHPTARPRPGTPSSTRTTGGPG